MGKGGNRLRALRRATGKGSAEVARELDVALLDWWKWEYNLASIPTFLAPTLADYFGVTIGYLNGWDR